MEGATTLKSPRIRIELSCSGLFGDWSPDLHPSVKKASFQVVGEDWEINISYLNNDFSTFETPYSMSMLINVGHRV